MVWDGTERRHVELELRDKIIETHTDVKHLVEWAKTHDKSDNDRFEAAFKRITWVEKTAYLGIGGLSVLSIILKMIK